MAKEETKESTLNVRIKDGDQFYANETSINFGPLEFVLDFKCSNHVQDMPDHKGLLIRHNPVILSPFHAKSLLGVLTNSLKNYEEKFGEIKKPVELQKAEKMIKKEQSKVVKEKPKSSDTFFG